jgi:hypothetical protein
MASLIFTGLFQGLYLYRGTLEKCSILSKVKEDDPAYNGGMTHRNTLVFRGLKFESGTEIGKKGAFFKGLKE